MIKHLWNALLSYVGVRFEKLPSAKVIVKQLDGLAQRLVS